MRLPASLCGAGLLAMTACVANPLATYNPFTDYGTKTAYFTSQCDVKASNGECVKASCKADEKSNCNDWAVGCLNHDGYFQGTGAGGTCSKIL